MTKGCFSITRPLPLLVLAAVLVWASMALVTGPAAADTNAAQIPRLDAMENRIFDSMGNLRMVDINVWLGTPQIARNLVIGDPIEICAPDYRNAATDAIGELNRQLRTIAMAGSVSNSAFRFVTVCNEDMSNDYINFVDVDARREADNNFFCGIGSMSGRPPNACILIPPRSGPPLYSFTGDLLVIMNSDRRDPNDDSRGTSDGDYQAIRRTIAHELGHLLGLGHPDVLEPAPSLMGPSAVHHLPTRFERETY